MVYEYRRAKIEDLKDIIALLAQDEFGKTREELSDDLDKRYIDSFHEINNDPSQYLLVAHKNDNIIATCHLTLIPSLTFIGSTRMQIEAVRVLESKRGENVGQEMIEFALKWGRKQGAKVFQLTTNKERTKALRFYKKMGFNATHEGMKLYLE